MSKLFKQKLAGFTIIEMVVTIVISSILAVGIVSFIGDSVDSLTTTTNRNKIAASGRIALDRMASELQNALPNSIRVTTADPVTGDQCLEFIPVRGSSTYINPPFSSYATTFDVIEVTGEYGLTGGYAVIYPQTQNRVYDGDNGDNGVPPDPSWPNFPANRRPIQAIESIADNPDPSFPNQSTVTLTKPHRFWRRSSNERFFIVVDPVSFCVVGQNLYRYANYGFYTSQVTVEEEVGVCQKQTPPYQRCLPNYAAAPNKMLITNDLDNAGMTAFAVSAQTLRRNSLVSIQFNFTANNDSVVLNHEVLARGVP